MDLPIQWLEWQGLPHSKKISSVMPLFALPLTVEVTCHMPPPLQWPHRWGLSHVIKDNESATSV